jgi:endoglucanase
MSLVAASAGCLALASQAFAATPRLRVTHSASSHAAGVFFSSSVYSANENAGQFAVTIERTDPNGPETVYFGVTNRSAQAGVDFDKIDNTEATFAPGQSTVTFHITVHDQGINGPMRTARAYLYGAHPQQLGTPRQATVDLLQNDPLDTKNPQNPLGYRQAPTNGDPLQHVKWYVFGSQAPAGKALERFAHTNPGWVPALHTIAYSPGAGSYRFWMWNQPGSSLAGTVEKYLADDEAGQPNTTVALSTYSLVHGSCEDPSAIKSRYENWITQLAHGIGNFRAVLYLEEDSLMETHCLSHAQLQTRLGELAYAVNALSKDPHLLIYMDAGAPDGWNDARQTADDLRQAGVSGTAGFYVNATHEDWTTSDIHYGQQIAQLTGDKHFIVQTDDNGRGPLVPKGGKDNGNEDLCNPAGRGSGPLTTDTGYKYLDGLLWFNNPGNSDGPCGMGAPPVAQFWAPYAVGLVEHGTQKITGPHFDLLTS